MNTPQTANGRAVGSTDWLCRIRSIAERLAEVEPRLRLAKNQEDKSAEPQPEAATFLKWDGGRLGRDLELYNFMCDIEGVEATTTRVLEEIILPLKKLSPAAFAAGVAGLRSLEVFGGRQNDWEALLDELAA